MNTPIFDQLVAEYAARGKRYDNLVRKIPTGVPTRVRPFAPAVSSTAPVAVPMDVLEAVKASGEDETMSFRVVKPIAVVNLSEKDTAA